jgi:hypothetical protein
MGSKQDRDAPTLEVEGNLIQLGPVADVRFRVSEDRIVQRTVNAGLERTVEAGKPQDLRAISAACIDVADQPDLRFGKRPGLVGAQRVHGAKVVDGREPFDDDAVTRKTQGAACERDGDHHRQQLRGEADREREREHDRREPWPLEQHVGGEHEEHEKEGQTQDQEAELAYTDLEGIGRPAPAELRRETADASLPARPADQRGCGPADDGGPHEDEIGFLGGLLGPTGNLAVVLFGRVRLAGQQGLVDEEVTRFYPVGCRREQYRRRRASRHRPAPSPRNAARARAPRGEPAL